MGMSDDPIAEELHKLVVDELYMRIEVLKTNDFERTELVTTDTGQRFIRKYIKDGEGVGTQYGRLVSLSCPHLPRLINLYRMNDELVVILEYVEGCTLREAIEDGGPFSTSRALAIMEDVFDAVETLHTQFRPPIIHRDINPSNVVLGSRGAVLIDLGIARTYQDGATHDTRTFGTIGYAAPEQFGFGQSDVRTDIYALGMLLYFMLTGHDPQTDLSASMEGHTEFEPWIRDTISMAISLRPEERFSSVKAFRNALRIGSGAVSTSSPESAASVAAPAPAPASPTSYTPPLESKAVPMDVPATSRPVSSDISEPSPPASRKFPRRSIGRIVAIVIATVVYLPILIVGITMPWRVAVSPRPVDLVVDIVSYWSIVLLLFGIPYLILLDPGHITYRIPRFKDHRVSSIIMTILVAAILTFVTIPVATAFHSDDYKTMMETNKTQAQTVSVGDEQ